MQVADDVRLEVLDWGGSGRSVVLLAGGGNTAHVFDEFAPKLANNYHVYGITRRGFGVSGFSAPNGGIDRLRDDILDVIEALGLNRPVLVGHSIAGAEMSALVTSHPERLAGLVYLEAGYPYAFDNGHGPTMQEFQDMRGPRAPAPTDSDLAGFNALQRWDERIYGFRMPEAEFRQTWEADSAGRPVKLRDSPGSQIFATILTGEYKYATISVPTLAIFAIPHVPESWVSESNDPKVRASAATYYAAVDGLAERQAKAFETAVPSARVIRLRGTHYVFLSEETNVLREIRSFIADLP